MTSQENGPEKHGFFCFRQTTAWAKWCISRKLLHLFIWMFASRSFPDLFSLIFTPTTELNSLTLRLYSSCSSLGCRIPLAGGPASGVSGLRGRVFLLDLLLVFYYPARKTRLNNWRITTNFFSFFLFHPPSGSANGFQYFNKARHVLLLGKSGQDVEAVMVWRQC